MNPNDLYKTNSACTVNGRVFTAKYTDANPATDDRIRIGTKISESEQKDPKPYLVLKFKIYNVKKLEILYN
jgi:hypothetical protein